MPLFRGRDCTSPGAEPDLLCHGHTGALDTVQGVVLANKVPNGPLALTYAGVLDPCPHGDGAHTAAAKLADILHAQGDQGRVYGSLTWPLPPP